MKYIHISFDDVYTCLWDLTQKEKTYTSIFENAFLADLKLLHQRYRAVFSLYLFNKVDDCNFQLSDVTGKFFSEFAANSDWLKFGFHAEDEKTNYNTDGGIEQSYECFCSAIMNKLGGEKSLDYFTRLGFFSGAAENVMKLKKAPHGIIGLLSADDTRTSYSLEREENDELLKRGALWNAKQNMLYIRSQKRLEVVSSTDELIHIFSNRGVFENTEILEIFLHEYSYYDQLGIPQMLETCVKFAAKEGYHFDFLQNNYDIIKADIISAQADKAQI